MLPPNCRSYSRSPRGRVRSTLARGRHPLARLSVVARSPKPHVESKETVTCFEAHSEAQSSSTAIDSSLMLRPSKSVRDKTKGRSRLVLLESHVREMTACNHALCWAWCLGGRWVCTATGRRNAFSCIFRPRARVWAAVCTSGGSINPIVYSLAQASAVTVSIPAAPLSSIPVGPRRQRARGRPRVFLVGPPAPRTPIGALGGRGTGGWNARRLRRRPIPSSWAAAPKLAYLKEAEGAGGERAQK